MSHSPDDDFYGSSTELPPQEDFPQQDLADLPTVEQPGFPQLRPAHQPGAEQAGFPQSGPVSQPGIESSQPRFSPQGPPKGPEPRTPRAPDVLPPQGQRPLSPPNLEQPRPPLGPGNQSGFEQTGYVKPMDPRGRALQNPLPQRRNEQNNREQEQANFPPPSGPMSQPGFSSIEQPPQRYYPTPMSRQAGNQPQSGGSVAPGEHQVKLPSQPTWQPQQPNTLANWPTTVQPPSVSQPQRSRLMLIIALVGLALLIIGSGTFVLFSQKSTNITPGPQNTSTTHQATSVATHPTQPTANTGGFNSINTPVQAGTDWVVTITSARTTTSSLIAPNAGNTYLELHLVLKNTSSKRLTIISILEFILTDTHSHRYNETATDTNIRRPPDGNFNAQQTLNAQLAYEVPKSQHTFILTFAYGLSSNSNGTVSWSIQV